MMALLFTIEKTRDLTSDVKFVLLSTVPSYLYPRLLECAIPIPRCDVPIDRVCREVDPLTLLTLFQCLLLDRKIVLMSHKPWKLTDTFETVRGVRAWSSRMSLFHVSIMPLKLQKYHSYCSFIPWKKITRKSPILECTLNCDENSDTNARTQVQSMMFPFRVKYSYPIYEPLVPLSENLKEILQNPYPFCLGT